MLTTETLRKLNFSNSSQCFQRFSVFQWLKIARWLSTLYNLTPSGGLFFGSRPGIGFSAFFGFLGIDVLMISAASFESTVDPEILFRSQPDVFCHKFIDPQGVGVRIGRGEIREGWQDMECVGAVRVALPEKGHDGSSGHAGDAAGGGVGEGRDAKKWQNGGKLGFFPLIRGIPDRVAVFERADQAAQIVHGDGGDHLIDAAAVHFPGDDRVVRLAEEAAHGKGV